MCLIRTHPTVSVFRAFLFVKCDMLCVMVFLTTIQKRLFNLKKAFLLTHCKNKKKIYQHAWFDICITINMACLLLGMYHTSGPWLSLTTPPHQFFDGFKPWFILILQLVQTFKMHITEPLVYAYNIQRLWTPAACTALTMCYIFHQVFSARCALGRCPLTALSFSPPRSAS